MKYLVLMLALPFNFSLATQAQTASNSRYSIIYGSPSWNTSPTKINSAFLVIRDKTSKKLIQVNLEETAPDSSEFKGVFQFQLAGQSTIVPEVYIPPQALRGQLDRFYALIQAEKIFRKPTIIKRIHGESVIDVYDTKEQAERAWEAYQESQNLRAQAVVPKTPALPDQKNILEEAAILAAKQEADKEQERIRLEQIAKQKILDRIEEQKRLNATEKAKRVRQAQDLADQGMVAFNQNDFAKAEELFKQSAELDPENKAFYYKYGVTLYKNQKFNEALVAFKVAPVESDLEIEKAYFTALSHYSIKENKRALEQFKIVAESGDEDLSASALFYQGTLLFGEERFEEAQSSFEKVLDVSKDPKLDAQAEAYIEAIIKAQSWAKMRSKKFLLSGTAGLMYDSNVLLAPDLETAQGSSQKEGDVRLVTIGDLTYKAMMTETSSFNVNASANITNSSKNDLASADPWLYSLKGPYSMTVGKTQPGQLVITPGVETLFMAADGSSEKKNILNSYLARVDYLKPFTRTWFANYTLEYRMDDFELTSSLGPNDLDSNKFAFSHSQTAMVGPGGKEALSGSVGLTRNQAKGSEKLYNRYEFGVSYARPVLKSSVWMSSLSYYFLDYTDSSDGRKDNNLTLTSAYAQPIREWFTWGIVGSFSNNVSTESSTYSYDKFTIMTTATFNTAF